ncbi:MAG: hydroxymethylbilane synthase [Acidobacteria bacterium]|nr:hydroxymethylbilane synthase [Acidobacteriota bacterium]
MKLTIGSRGSQLALWQANWVAARLADLGVETHLEIIRTTGDKITDVPLAKVGSKGLFTKEIEEALLDRRIDLAVHSLKDLPTILPDGLTVAAIPEREIPFDALIGSTLQALPQGARVGTSSLRRSAQLKRLRPDLILEPIRGNLDTRLRKLDEGQFQAILLAGAGLRRLGWGHRITELLPADLMCPAVGQGALAIETRADSGDAFRICSQLDHAPTRAAVTAERAVLAALGGGCQVPIGAHAVVENDQITLRAVVVHPDGDPIFEDRCSAPAANAATLGAASARRLLDQGASAILASVYGGDLPLAGRRILVTRAQYQAGTFSSKLRALGAEVVELPVIEIHPIPFERPEWPSYHWAIFTSANAVEAFFSSIAATPGPKLCAIGPATAGALRAAGLQPDLLPDQFVAESLAESLSAEPLHGKRILLPRAASARDVIPDQLRALGAQVDVLPVYENRIPDGLSERTRELLAAWQPDYITLTSSSTAKNLLAAAGPGLLAGIPVASIGPITSEAARRLGLAVAIEAPQSTTDSLVEAIVAEAARHAPQPVDPIS